MLNAIIRYSHFEFLFHVITGRVQQKIQFSHFFSGEMLNSIGNYEYMKLSVFDTHPPLIHVLMSYVKEIMF